VPVVELSDLTEEGKRLGLSCRVAMFPALAERVDGTEVLTRLRDALRVTADDESLTLFRRVCLYGERPLAGEISIERVTEAGRFLARARAGIGGTSRSGHMLALNVPGRNGPEMVVCLLWLPPIPVAAPHGPSLLLLSPDTMLGEPEFASWSLR
jgi:hypothetical protein